MPLSALDGVPRGAAAAFTGTPGILPYLRTNFVSEECYPTIVNATNFRDRTVLLVGQRSDASCAVYELRSYQLFRCNTNVAIIGWKARAPEQSSFMKKAHLSLK